jgi:transcriptional regulator with XRE-family HTH domain
MSLSPLRLHRLEKGWSQYHLGFLCGVAQVQISYAERGYPILSNKQKEKIAEAFEMPVGTLFPEQTIEENH